MSFSEDQLVKRARMLRHAHRGLPNVLKARFSPTAIWTTETEDEDPTPTPRATTTNAVGPIVTRPNPTTTPVVIRPTPDTAIATPTVIVRPTTTPSIVVTPGTSTNVAIVPTTSTTSTTSTTTSATPTTSTPSSTLAPSSQTEALFTRTISTRLSSSATSLGSASSATSTSTSSPGITTAGIVGIAAAGVVGAVVVVGLVMFFLRRKWNDKQEFDQDAFRRQSVVLRDDASSLHRGNSNGRGGFGPRPPTMFERHHQNIATFANSSPNMYQSAGSYPSSGNPFNDPTSYQSPSFGPGMYAPGPMSPAPTAQYANTSPFYNPPSQSPAGSPVTVTPYGGAAFDAQGRLVRTPSTAPSSMVSRNNSVAHPPYPPEEADYADLTRSSVTPFQAAQYEAISKQLNIPTPKPLHQVPEGEEIDEPKHAAGQNLSLSAKDINSGPLVSPFEDPQASLVKIASENGNAANSTPAHVSSEILTVPEPASRVPSMPPSLPEIRMMSGSFSPVNYSFPVTPSPRKGSFDIHSGRASPKVDMPPLTPVSSSPRRAQFVDGLEARAHDGHETPVEIDYVGKDAKIDVQAAEAKPEASKANVKTGAPKRPETIYSDDDAYGGF